MQGISKNFYYLIIGQGLSRLGNNFFTLALLWYVLEDTGSSMYVGLTAILLTIPNIFSMFTGVIVDRYNRWNIILFVEIVQIVLTLSLAIIGWAMGLHIVMLVVFTIFIQTLGAFFGPAENAVIPLLVPNKEKLVMANSLNQLITMVSKIVGMAVGGILMTIFGPITLILINSLTFAFSLISILLIRPWKLPALNEKTPENIESQANSSLYQQWKLGFLTVLKTPALKKIIPIAILVNFSLAPMMSLNPAWVKNVLKLGSSAYGFVEASMFAGIIFGIILVNFLHKKIPYHRLVPITLLMMASSVILLSSFPYLYVTITCMVIFGIAGGIINTSVFTIMQWVTPNEVLGRVSGMLIGATNISLPLGMAIGSIMSSYIPLAYVFLSGGVLSLIGVLISLNLPKIELEEKEITINDKRLINEVSS